MKEKFFELVKKVKETGIADAICKTTSAEELRNVFQSFVNEHKELYNEIREWGDIAKTFEFSPFFQEHEYPECPLEVAIILYICGYDVQDEEACVTEFDIFEDYCDLVDSIALIENSVARAIARLILEDSVFYITPEGIFKSISSIK